MIHIILPDEDPRRRVPFYLAMEEWAATALPSGDYVFTWIVGPTVVFGRNQVMEKEVDLKYCREKGIDTVRRKSGGGCIYADRDNIMFSYITPRQNVEGTYVEYTSLIVDMLGAQGVKAEATGRNDICISGRKVSGSAFYHLPGRSIVHGTMLYSTNVENMCRAITPSKSKLESKKVKSVESHITMLNEWLDVDIETFRRRAEEFLTTEQLVLTPEQVAEIEAIEQGYYTREWLEKGAFARNMPLEACRTLKASRRLEGAGEFGVIVTLDGQNLIQNVTLTGDFFGDSDPSGVLTRALKGHPHSEPEIISALSGIETPVRGTEIKDLAALIASAV